MNVLSLCCSTLSSANVSFTKRIAARGAETGTRLELDEKGDELAMEWVPAAHVTRWVATQALLGLL